MEFFIYVDREKPILQGITMSYADMEMEVGEVIKRFAEATKNAYPNFDPSKYNVYLYDFTNPTESNDPSLISDLSVSVASLNTQNFDLILSTTQPTGYIFSDIDVEQETDDEYNQLIQQGKMYYELKDYHCAFQLFQHAMNLNKLAVLPIRYQVKIYIKAKRYRTAMQVAQTGLNVFSSDRELITLYAKALQLSGNHIDAICYFKRLIMLPPHTQQAIDDINCHIAKSLIEMGSLDQAMSLLQPIATNNPTNLKVALLMAKTLYRQGRIHDALHIVLQSFSINPYHKESREFIGNCIVTENQAEILRSQLGDGIDDAKVLFIMGHILYEHGSCEIARSFLKDALELSSEEPSIAVTYLLNTLCISNSAIQTMDSAMPFINTITKRNDDFAKVASSIDFVHLVDAFTEKEKYEGKKMEPVKYGDKESVYHMEQLDVFWFLFIIETVLFTSGYISRARELAEALLPLMKPYTLSKTVINHLVPSFSLISSLAQSTSLPLVKTEKQLYFVGDSHCLPLSWKTLKIGGEEMLANPLFINQLSISHLAEKRDPLSVLFWNTVSKIPEDSNVILFVGFLDCAEKVFSKLSRIEFDNLQEGFVAPAQTLARVCERLAKEKKLNIFVHPIPPTGFDKLQYARDFNKCVSEALKGIDKEVENVYFLDIFDQLISVSDDKEEILKQEYVFDGFHLNQSYQPILEEAMNKILNSPKETTAEAPKE